MCRTRPACRTCGSDSASTTCGRVLAAVSVGFASDHHCSNCGQRSTQRCCWVGALSRVANSGASSPGGGDSPRPQAVSQTCFRQCSHCGSARTPAAAVGIPAAAVVKSSGPWLVPRRTPSSDSSPRRCSPPPSRLSAWGITRVVAAVEVRRSRHDPSLPATLRGTHQAESVR